MKVGSVVHTGRMDVAGRVASLLPVRLSPHSYLTIQVRQRALGGSAGRVVAYLALVREGGERERLVRLVRLPGSRLVELWSPQDDPWLTGRSAR